MRLALLLCTALVVSCVPLATPAGSASATPVGGRPRFDPGSYMSTVQARGTLRVGTYDDDPPLASRDATGARSGFAIDLARDLAQAIFGTSANAEGRVQWISIRSDTAAAALAAGDADVVFARLVATRGADAQPFELSDPFFASGERILVRESEAEIKDLPDLDSKTVCTERSTPFADDVVAANAFAKTLALDSFASCLAALRAGQVDAIAADEATLWGLHGREPATKLVGRYLKTVAYGIAIKSGADSAGFRDFVNMWLAAAIRGGTWARAYEKDITPLSGERRTAPLP